MNTKPSPPSTGCWRPPPKAHGADIADWRPEDDEFWEH